MCCLLIFESDIKSSESWFLSGKILYFLGARVCYLLKIISWNVWKAAPVQLLPAWLSCVCDVLWEALLACLSRVNMFRSVFWTCILVMCMWPAAVHIRVVMCSVSCWWPVLSRVWSSPVQTHLWHARRHVLSLAMLSCAVSSGVCSHVPSRFGLTWVRSCWPTCFELLHVRIHVLSCGQSCVVNTVSLLFVMCLNTCSGVHYCRVRLPCYCCGFITCAVMCLVTFHHVVVTCSSLFYHDMSCCNVCHVLLCVSHAFVIWWHAAMCQSHVCDGLDTCSFITCSVVTCCRHVVWTCGLCVC